ncbi:MAG: hypothetical protein H7Z37_02100 [Pyrinomonadaceae bacterium]|nr:hypothetical protein [Pyrinomonadaceae bacterium]
MNTIISGNVGFVHIIASVSALIFGTLVLAMPKGSRIHRKIGYVYFVSMIIVVVTAFLIYRLFGGFGVFHAAAIVSGFALAAGMLPVIFRRPRGSWLALHFNFMYWSVIGLYAAFAAETLVRMPGQKFFAAVGIATFIVFAAGNIAFLFYKKKWKTMVAAVEQN